MNQQTVRRIAMLYGFEISEIYAAQKGYRNESHQIRTSGGVSANLMLYKREPNVVEVIRRANAVGTYLSKCGLPVRAPFDARVARIASGDSARYACLYNYLPGVTIPWEAYTQDHIKLLGQTMAELHATLVEYREPLPKVADEYQSIVARMERYFADQPVSLAVRSKLNLKVPGTIFTRFHHILSFCEKLPNQQALHMDFVRSNILFSDNSEPRVTGIIDFEKAAWGHPLFDVARTLAFLLVDCKYKSADKVRKYFLDSGYQKRGHRRLERIMVRGHSERHQLLEELIDLFLLYDFYKFLRHNPYEFLHQNEHYVRTRNLLLQRGVITTTPIGSPLAESLLQ